MTSTINANNDTITFGKFIQNIIEEYAINIQALTIIVSIPIERLKEIIDGKSPTDFEIKQICSALNFNYNEIIRKIKIGKIETKTNNKNSNGNQSFESTNRHFQQFFIETCKNVNLSYDDVAKLINVDPIIITTISKGKSPDLNTLRLLSILFNWNFLTVLQLTKYSNSKLLSAPNDLFVDNKYKKPIEKILESIKNKINDFNDDLQPIYSQLSLICDYLNQSK